MKELVIKDYQGTDLEWNENTGRFQLTVKYVKSLRDAMPYKNDSILKQRIKQTSLHVYNYIFNNSASVNRPVINFLLNKTENGYKFLLEVLTAQIEADMDWAYNDLIVRPVINASNGQTGDREQFRLNAISIECEEIIKDSIGYYLCVLYPFNWYLFDLVREYGD